MFIFSRALFYVMFDTGIFLFVVFTIYLTRLISLSIIFFGKYCYLYYLGDSWA